VRILHTADWHLGLRLYKRELSEEHKKFFQWLINLISERKIEVLLISGDVFDHANPSNEARAMYYDFLRQLIGIRCRVIITGGNHDSPGILNAPKDILDLLNVHVVGKVPDNISEVVIELNGTDPVIVCAIPFLREADIHRFSEGVGMEDRIRQVRTAISNCYTEVAELCNEKKGIPVIAMGHLFAAGSEVSDSEREIQVGNQSAITSSDLPSTFDYIALGHIHRPQYIAKQKHIRYSGSPIALSFSERSDKKIVIELEVRDKEIFQTDHPVPVFRDLKRLKGSFEELKTELAGFVNPGPAKVYAELDIIEEFTNPALHGDVSAFVADFEHEGIEILNYRITRTETELDITGMVDAETRLEEVSPVFVLTKMMETGNFTEEDKLLIMQAFIQLTEMEEDGGDA
jgi:DNA repair protein SbcD/Mre11